VQFQERTVHIQIEAISGAAQRVGIAVEASE
jgi:hypothetical protein